MMKKKLPIGVQTFSEMKEEQYLYVDKTICIHRLVEEGKTRFLSRPRRFGKFLLLSTIKELFKGNKELFEGLYIYDKWNWEEKYPVIDLDFSSRTVKTPEKLEMSLNLFIEEVRNDYDLKLAKRV
jgi:hypothetical protein